MSSFAAVRAVAVATAMVTAVVGCGSSGPSTMDEATQVIDACGLKGRTEPIQDKGGYVMIHTLTREDTGTKPSGPKHISVTQAKCLTKKLGATSHQVTTLFAGRGYDKAHAKLKTAWNCTVEGDGGGFAWLILTKDV